ncbi:MAG TPA: hypothetical protein VMY99_04010 [Nevskiaceae bacterium]|nr:hypothetical protein [Nevskiaceae bacterium]
MFSPDRFQPKHNTKKPPHRLLTKATALILGAAVTVSVPGCAQDPLAKKGRAADRAIGKGIGSGAKKLTSHGRVPLSNRIGVVIDKKIEETYANNSGWCKKERQEKGSEATGHCRERGKTKYTVVLDHCAGKPSNPKEHASVNKLRALTLRTAKELGKLNDCKLTASSTSSVTRDLYQNSRAGDIFQKVQLPGSDIPPYDYAWENKGHVSQAHAASLPEQLYAPGFQPETPDQVIALGEAALQTAALVANAA